MSHDDDSRDAGSAFDFYGDFGDDLPFQPLSRSTMTRARTDYRETDTLDDLQGPVFRSVAVDSHDASESEYMHPPTLPLFSSSKSMPAFADYREFGSATKSFPSDVPAGSDNPPDDDGYGGVFRSATGGLLSPFHQEEEPVFKRVDVAQNTFQGTFQSPFTPPPGKDFGLDDLSITSYQTTDMDRESSMQTGETGAPTPSDHQDAMLAEFARSADELDALFNESVSSGRILDLSEREVEDGTIPVAPSYFEVNTSFVSEHDLPEIMDALVLGLKACKADYERNDAAAKISGSAYYNLESADFEIHLYQNRRDPNLVVEFQRRYGDVMVFAEFYREMLWFLRNPTSSTSNIVARAADPNGALPPNVKDDGFGPIRNFSKEPGGIGETGVRGIFQMLASDFIECKREAAVLIARACRSDKTTIAKMTETESCLKELLESADKELCRCAVTAVRFLVTDKDFRNTFVEALLPSLFSLLSAGYFGSQELLRHLTYGVCDVSTTHGACLDMRWKAQLELIERREIDSQATQNCREALRNIQAC